MPLKPTFATRLKNYFKEYCEHTSIHGFQYLGEKRSYIELVWWLVVFVLCLCCCGYFIVLVYQKWENSPVIVSFATRETPIYEIPFPAVTICPETKTDTLKYNHSRMVSQLYHGQKLTEKEYKEYMYMSLLCDPMLEMVTPTEPTNSTFNEYYFSAEDFFDFLFRVTPNISESLIYCQWRNRDYPCTDLFDLVLTDEGVCATFNMFDNSKIYQDNVVLPVIPFMHKKVKKPTWSSNEGYAHNTDMNTFPRRALFAGASNALYVELLQTPRNIDHACKWAMQGFKVTLHTPSRVPAVRQQYLRLPLNEVVLGAIKPVMVTTTETVKVFKPEKRECYFPREKPIKYFREYSQKNCELACLTQFTLEWCGCVAFHMPRENGTEICGPLNDVCMNDAAEIVQKGYLNKLRGVKHKKLRQYVNYDKTKVIERSKSSGNDSEEYLKDDEIPHCNCLPLCTDLSYEVETSASSFNPKDVAKALFYKNETKLMFNDSVSVLTLYFKNNQFITAQRHELYGPTDFLANFGGLLGLFTGFSILSFMEIVYFLTVRIICNVRLYNSWSGKERDVEKNL